MFKYLKRKRRDGKYPKTYKIIFAIEKIKEYLMPIITIFKIVPRHLDAKINWICNLEQFTPSPSGVKLVDLVDNHQQEQEGGDGLKLYP